MVASKETKIFTMRMDELDDDATMIVCIVRVRMLKPLVDNLEVEEKEKVMASEEAADEDERGTE